LADRIITIVDSGTRCSFESHEVRRRFCFNIKKRLLFVTSLYQITPKDTTTAKRITVTVRLVFNCGLCKAPLQIGRLLRQTINPITGIIEEFGRVPPTSRAAVCSTAATGLLSGPSVVREREREGERERERERETER